MQIYNFSLKPRIPPEKASVQGGFRHLCPPTCPPPQATAPGCGQSYPFPRETDRLTQTDLLFILSICHHSAEATTPLGCSDTDGQNHFTNCVKFHIIALPIYNDCDTFAKVAFSQPPFRTDNAPHRLRDSEAPRLVSRLREHAHPRHPATSRSRTVPAESTALPHRRAPNTTNPYTPQILNEV